MLSRKYLAALLLLPLFWSLILVASEMYRPGYLMGSDPNEELLHFFGGWAIRILLLSYALAGLNRWLPKLRLLQSRRMVGLFAFFYLALHFSTFVTLYVEPKWDVLMDEVIQRPYITVGAIALALLCSMALTSTDRARRMMGVYWKKLHGLIHLAVPLALIHYFWALKVVNLELVVYLFIFSFVVLERVTKNFRKVARFRIKKTAVR